MLVQTGEELVDLLKQGQGVLNILPLATVKEEVDSAIVELRPAGSEDSDEEISPQVISGS